MIVKFDILNPKIKNIDKVCSYLNSNVDELFYIEGIRNDMFFNPIKVFLTENNLQYCRNKLGYPFVIFSNKNKAYIVSKKFMDELKVIKTIVNRNNKESY